MPPFSHIHCSVTWLLQERILTMEPRYNEGPRDWQNVFAIKSFWYIEVHFHMFYYYWGKEYLTIIPRARMGSESIAHSAFGLMGY